MAVMHGYCREKYVSVLATVALNVARSCYAVRWPIFTNYYSFRRRRSLPLLNDNDMFNVDLFANCVCLKRTRYFICGKLNLFL